MERRAFIEAVTLGAVGGLTVPGAAGLGVAGATAAVGGVVAVDTSANAECGPAPQRLHPDAQTEPQGIDYFFLGNGRLVAVIQQASGKALACGMTPLGVLLWDPHHFARKWSTFTFHPEWGLQRGMVSVAVGDATYALDAASLAVERAYPEGVPVVEARWQAGPHPVVERFWVAEDAPLLVREVAVENASTQAQQVGLSTTLYHNHILFTDYHTDHAAGVLRAHGYPHMELFADRAVRLDDRKMHLDLGRIEAGSREQATLFYLIRERREIVDGRPVEARRQAARSFYQTLSEVETADPGLNTLYRAARDGIHAVVSEEGRFDASVWQYNMEWAMDASNVAIAAVQTGQFDRAAAIIHHLVTRLTNEKGAPAQASRFHEGLTSEIGHNGVLLGALWSYAAWTGDLALIRTLWPQIRRIANFPISEPFLHESGLLQTDIEIFERTTEFGILRGFEAAYQSLIAWGLGRAAELAALVGDEEHARHWSATSARLAEAMLYHPTHSLVEDGVIIKRRTLDGRWQQTLVPQRYNTDLLPPGMPLAEADGALLDPDVTTLYPVLLRQVDPVGPIAQASIDRVETLWDAYGIGGYGRYHPSGEPDSPGAWAFPTAIAARALAEAGRAEQARRALDWYLTVPRSRGGAFFEFYYAETPRPVPPLPPTGFIVWAWAELSSLFVEQMLGARAGFDALRFSPRRIAGLDEIRGRLRFRDARLDVHVRWTGHAPGARYNGQPLDREDDAFVLPLPIADGRVEIDLT